MPDTTVAYLLNKMFPKGLADTTFRDPKNTFLALVDKDPAAKGDSFEVALQYSLGGGRSADFATAKRNNNGGAGGKMRFTYADDFAWARVPAKEWQAAKNNGGVTDILDLKFSNAMRKIKRSLATGVAGDGTGNFGRIAFLAGTGSPVVPAGAFRLADWRQTQSIEVGDVIQSNPNRSGSPGTMRNGTAVITKVTRGRASGGLIYFQAVNGWAPAVNDYLYIEGDYGVKINGIQAWIPDVAPTAGDNFGGVDRSVDDVRLAGIRVDMTGQSSYEDALVLGMEEFRTYSADTSIILTSPYDYTRLENELGDKKRIVDIPNRYELGLTGLKMADGSVLTQDPWFPKGRAYPLDLSTWTLMSIGDAPHLADEDSLKMLRVSDADAFDAMMRSWSNLKCADPSQNGVIIMPA